MLSTVPTNVWAFSMSASSALRASFTSPMMTFRRGAIPMAGLAGALPTQANVGAPVRIVDENTVSNAAIGANDLSAKLLLIDGSDFWVEF